MQKQGGVSWENPGFEQSGTQPVVCVTWNDAQAYAEWMGDDIDSATKSIAGSVEELRAEKGNYQILSVDEAVAEVKRSGVLLTQPLCGGMPIDYAWESLETIVQDVLPKVGGAS